VTVQSGEGHDRYLPAFLSGLFGKLDDQIATRPMEIVTKNDRILSAAMERKSVRYLEFHPLVAPRR
jgi:hypothetical protein